MSNKMHPNATIEGLEGPFFPEELIFLHHALYTIKVPCRERFAFENEILRSAFAEGILMEVRRPLISSDGYEWFMGLATTTTVIALPKNEDHGAQNGMKSDRHSALHTVGKVPEEEIGRLLNWLIIAFRPIAPIRATWSRKAPP